MKKIRKMKKVLAFILALTLVLGMSATVFAGEVINKDEVEYDGDDYITFKEPGGVTTNTIKKLTVKKIVDGKPRVADEEFKMVLYKRLILTNIYYEVDSAKLEDGDEHGFSISYFGDYIVREQLTDDQKEYYDKDEDHQIKNKKVVVTNTAKKEVYHDWNPVTIKKELKINNPGTVNPAETFNFSIGGGLGLRDGVELTAPSFDPDTFTINVAKGGTKGTANITLPDFTKVGVYTYPISEVAGKTAGMTYDDETLNLVVTVINNPDYVDGGTEEKFLRVLTITDKNNIKRDSFENNFSAGDLTINKETTGNYTDPDDKFTVTVTLTPIDGKNLVASAIDHDGNFSQDQTTGVVTITYNELQKGSSFTIQNIPYDVTYTVEETTADGYATPEYDEDATGKIEQATTSTTIINHRDTTIETGINLDNIPYILMIVVVTGGLVGFTLKKRFTGRE